MDTLSSVAAHLQALGEERGHALVRLAVPNTRGAVFAFQGTPITLAVETDRGLTSMM